METEKEKERWLGLLEEESKEEFKGRRVTEDQSRKMEDDGLAIIDLFIMRIDLNNGPYIILRRKRAFKSISETKKKDLDRARYCKLFINERIGIFINTEMINFERPIRTGRIAKADNNEIMIKINYEDRKHFVGLATRHKRYQETKLIVSAILYDVTSRRCKDAIKDVFKPLGNMPYLHKVLMGLEDPRTMEATRTSDFSASGLNEYQERAIKGALEAQDVYLIHGPPGTGKTRTVGTYIAAEIKRGNKVLACCPSNAAIDNLVKALQSTVKGLNLCRTGNVDRMNDNSRKLTIDAIIEGRRKVIICQEKEVAKEKTKYEFSAFEILDSVDVVLTTNASAGHHELLNFMKRKKSDGKGLIVVIDEAGQSTEPLCWIPIRYTSKVILAGDHNQLQPTVKSKVAAAKGLEISMFQRLMEMKTKNGKMIPKCLLRIQYRMSPTIMKWCSDAMYEGQLMASGSAKKINIREEIKHKLRMQGNWLLKQVTSADMVMIDTTGRNEAEHKDESYSKYNRGEINYIKCILYGLKLFKMSIGIITPYAAQVAKIKWILNRDMKYLRNLDIEIGTVDGYQGREKDIIIFSMVRSNDSRETGFLSDKKRINVAITRAKKLVILIGDCLTICHDDFISDMVRFIEKNGKVIRNV